MLSFPYIRSVASLRDPHPLDRSVGGIVSLLISKIILSLVAIRHAVLADDRLSMPRLGVAMTVKETDGQNLLNAALLLVNKHVTLPAADGEFKERAGEC